MARPLWSEAGSDPAAIADFLDASAAAATDLAFAPAKLAATDGSLLHRAAVLRAKRLVQDRHGDRDRILAQEVRAIDDLVRTSNLLVERLREWYSLHAPEAVRLAGDAERLAALVAEHGQRARVLEALGDADAAAATLGSDLDPADLAALQGFAAALRGVHTSWRSLERRVEDTMAEIAPNIAGVVGPVLGARLIAQAGSLQRLATMPAGTIQTLGAETALFRSIKEGTRPPKHGFLFQHPKVHQASPWQRGAVARALALHICTAAKADAFTQNDLLDDLRASLQADLDRIGKDKAKPKARPSGPRGPGPRGRSGPPHGRSGPKGKGGPGGRFGGPAKGSPAGKGGFAKGRRQDGGRARDHAPRTGGAAQGPPRRKGPGAFRNQGGGPAKPPGKGDRGGA